MTVQHNEEKHEFYFDTPEGRATLTYERDGDRLNFFHTFVPPALRDRGIAEEIVKAGFAYVAKNRLKVIPSCPYVARLVMKNDDWKQWVAAQ